MAARPALAGSQQPRRCGAQRTRPPASRQTPVAIGRAGVPRHHPLLPAARSSAPHCRFFSLSCHPAGPWPSGPARNQGQAFVSPQTVDANGQNLYLNKTLPSAPAPTRHRPNRPNRPNKPAKLTKPAHQGQTQAQIVTTTRFTIDLKFMIVRNRLVYQFSIIYFRPISDIKGIDPLTSANVSTGPGSPVSLATLMQRGPKSESQFVLFVQRPQHAHIFDTSFRDLSQTSKMTLGASRRPNKTVSPPNNKPDNSYIVLNIMQYTDSRQRFYNYNYRILLQYRNGHHLARYNKHNLYNYTNKHTLQLTIASFLYLSN